jgi:16S rRNA (guanine527-N7)-methyltransferase
VEQSTLPVLFTEHFRLLELSLTEDQIRQCVLFTNELKSWNQTANLTSITDDEAIVVKHFIDSLVALKANIKEGARILDVGSGAGFPAIPLKIARPDLSFLLIDPAHKKVSFLRYIVGLLRLPNVSIFCGTLKEWIESEKSGLRFDFVTFRAVNYLDVLEDCSAVLTDTGQVIAYSSKPIQQSELGPRWSVVHTVTFNLPLSYGSRAISLLKRVDLQCST